MTVEHMENMAKILEEYWPTLLIVSLFITGIFIIGIVLTITIQKD